MLRILILAIASLLLTHAYFIEYRPGLRKVEIPYDLKGFHYPLFNYAFQSLQEGRFPEWDPSNYCGAPFAANVQAALFYPPTWLLFAANAGKPQLRYQSVQDLEFLHVALAFVLCFFWLRYRGLTKLACALGSCVFALSGYMMLQLQHFGLIAGYPWLALAFWGIDQAHKEHRWFPLWKVAVASALCFLAGYTPFWVVFALVTFAYSVGRTWPVRVAFGTGMALAFSLVLSAVQILPAQQASEFLAVDSRYSSIKRLDFFFPFVAPNYGNFNMDVPPGSNPGFEYLYLGAAGLLGLLALRSFRGIVPGLAVLATSLFFLTDPFHLLAPVLLKPSRLSMLIRDWYFLGGITASLAMIAATGLDGWLRKDRAPVPRWLSTAAIAAAIAWSVALLAIWVPGGIEFPADWPSFGYTVVTAALLALLLRSYRGSAITAAAILVLVGAEYKAFGTWKRTNAQQFMGNGQYPDSPLQWIIKDAIAEMRAHPDFRVALDLPSIFPGDLRHAGLKTPQGFDPFLPEQYRRLILAHQKFRTDREFEISPRNESLLNLLGVGYYMTSSAGEEHAYLLKSDRYQPRYIKGDWLRLYQLKGARPAYGWEATEGAARTLRWEPELRRLEVSSPAGGRFRHSEQFFPGWTATVDGEPVPVARCHEALQCVDVPAGAHTLEFRYQSEPLRTGAGISAGAWALLLGGLGLRRWRSRGAR